MSIETENALIRQADTRATGAARFNSQMLATVIVFAASALMILASRGISPSFGGGSQLKSILVLSTFIIVIGFGQGLVILLGGLDLSVASVCTLGGVLAFSWIGSSASALALGLPLVLLATASVGAVNGVGVAVLRVPAFIMTLASGIIVYSICLGFTGGSPRGAAPPVLSALFVEQVAGVPIIIFLMIAVALLGTLIQSGTAFGRKLYAIGSGETAAFIAGIPVRLLTIGAYAIAGACSGLAGVLMVGYAGGATLTMGQPYLLPSIAAVVVGGASILGGRGSYIGTVGGAILLTTITTIIAALQMPEGWRTMIYGGIILLALIFMSDGFIAQFRPRSVAGAAAPMPPEPSGLPGPTGQ
jgi:ribose transport system permease protein